MTSSHSNKEGGRPQSIQTSTSSSAAATTTASACSSSSNDNNMTTTSSTNSTSRHSHEPMVQLQIEPASSEPIPLKRIRKIDPDSVSLSSSRAARMKKDRLQSFQHVIRKSMEETQRVRSCRANSENDLSTTGMIIDTMKDIKGAASCTIASIKEWANHHQSSSSHRGGSGFPASRSFELDGRGDSYQHQHRSSKSSSAPLNGADSSHQNHGSPHSEPDLSKVGRHHSGSGVVKAASSGEGNNVSNNASFIRDLAWPLAVCGIEITGGGHSQPDMPPSIRKVKEAVTRVVSGDLNAANDIWKFAAGNDDDDNTVGTLDTLQEENNQIRRLGSWGTVNTSNTGGTNDTGYNSLDPSKSMSVEIKFGLEDDDGNAIDPVLLEKAQKCREKRTPRREKLVKFDYPPIKSLKQCPRPDPEDLPDLFFTEHELDQIEDDRFCTMSTDDIEIVAVASKTSESEAASTPAATPAKFRNYKSPRANKNVPSGPPPMLDSAPPGQSTEEREQPEAGWRQTKGRPSTPHRRRHTEEEDDPGADFPAAAADQKSPSNSGRLVRGVQIYLRERSTGA